MRRLLAIVLLLFCWSASAATNIWYVDDIGTGANDGTSWANAWRDFDDIVWGSVDPGDMIWVSGGTYTDEFRVQAAGTGSSKIIIKASQEVGHNDEIHHLNSLGALSSGSHFIIDGSKADGITLTNTFHTKTVVPTNVNWFTKQGVFNTAGDNITLRWLSFSNYDGVSHNRAITWDNGDMTNDVIEYCWFHELDDAGVVVGNGNNPVFFNDLTIRWCYFNNLSDDFYEGQAGVTIHNNYINRSVRTWSPSYEGHPDGFAGNMGHNYIYNNVMVDVWDQVIYQNIWPLPDDSGHVYVYGNLIYMDQFGDPPKADGVQNAMSFGWTTFNPLLIPPTNYWCNVVIANNTIIARGTNGPGHLKDGIALINGRSLSNTTIITNMMVANNIFYQSPSCAASLKGGTNGGWAAGFFYNDTDLMFEYNVAYSTAADGKTIRYLGTTNADAEAFNAATIWNHNTSSAPTFVSVAAHDYRLDATDTVARNTGTNLSGLSLPGFDKDLWGNTRGADGTWDRGASEYTAAYDSNLLVWLTFQQSFDSCVLSNSATNWHALRWGRTNEPCPSNFPTRVNADTIPGRTNITGRYAGNFTWWTSDYSAYNREGQYAGITNGMERLSNMANATIMCWGKYHTTGIAGGNYSTEAQNTFIDAGNLNKQGGWSLGRYNGPDPSPALVSRTAFVVVTNTGADASRDVGIIFPDSGLNSVGNTTNWHHYLILWSNGVAFGFYDGEYWTNSDVSASGTTHLNVNYSWIGIGVRTHMGTPSMSDTGGGEDYPNHGWLNGAMDDVRIYDRLLTPTEVYNIYTNTGGIPSADEEVPPASTNAVRKMGMRGRSSTRGNVRIR